MKRNHKTTKISRAPLKISDYDLPHLANVHSKEELLFLLESLNDEQCKILLRYYQQNKPCHPDLEKTLQIVGSTDNLEVLKEKLRKEISLELIHEYLSLKKKLEPIDKEKDFIQMKFANLPAKIKIFSITGSKDDFVAIKKKLHQFSQSLAAHAKK